MNDATMVTGPRWKRSDTLQFKTYVVGREQGCDIRLDDASVSRRHAEIVPLSGGRLHVTDRATINGTFLRDGDDWRAIRQAILEPTDRIRFGDCQMTAGPSPAAPPRSRSAQASRPDAPSRSPA